MAYPEFDRSRLRVQALSARDHDLDLSSVLPLDARLLPLDSASRESLQKVARRIMEAKERRAAVILMIGAHVLRAGVQRYLIDLMERGLITHIATNGAGPIHDFELALIGKTTESVSRYIRTGEFGLWKETGRLNDLAAEAQAEGIGFGEAVGRELTQKKYPHRELSIFAAGYRLRIPITVHLGIGYDIIHELPNASGAALGAASYTDFLVFAKAVEALEGGVLMNLGTAVMGPEIYLKALSMARNVASQEQRQISDFTTLVCDLLPLENTSREASKNQPGYYFRPWKTILVRTVADGGESFYVQGRHSATIPNLYQSILGHLSRKLSSQGDPRD